MMEKVGLDPESWQLIPWRMPCTSCVFPAPREPTNPMTVPGSRVSAICLPRACISVAECTRIEGLEKIFLNFVVMRNKFYLRIR